MLNLSLLALSNHTMLLILMAVLIVFLVLLAVLGIVFIIALRKRAPVIKVVMAPTAAKAAAQPEPEEEEAEEEEPKAEQLVMDEVAEQPAAQPQPQPQPEPEEEEDDVRDPEDVEYVTEGKDSVRYDRSYTAKIIQLKDDSKEWYTQIKNELLSYQRVKARISWKRETFRLGRNPIARLIVRGKTLCLLLAVEPAGFTGTKFSVEDVSRTASMEDTPTLYRIKSGRRAKYAKELVNAVMRELSVHKQPNFEPEDYYMPYEGTMGLMERGLIKRVVTSSSRTFEIREVSEEENEAAAAEAETTEVTEAPETVEAAEPEEKEENI